MKLFWTPEAVRDREEIYEYISADSPESALTLDELFEEKARHLPVFPALGRPGRLDGTRELLVHRNYFMVYDVKNERIRIVRVLHGARRWLPKI